MLVNIEKVTVSERFRKDFGNIDELAQDIETNGLINPPVVTHEYELLAGERRLRACKHLGMQQIEVRVMAAKDESHKKHMEYSENENRKDFTFSERLAAAKELERLEREKAKERQGNRTDKQGDIPQNFAESSTTAAKQSGFGNR
ncbi:MAG TPA: ParB N-terminal domain-containing protein, partial [Bacillales bacterium]|nr:ParB N-terminal domain-containing protein [Bacillales bacterium]